MRLAIVVALTLPQFAVAADPSDPRSRVPPIRYESVFSIYRLSPDEPLRSWRSIFDANGEFADESAPRASAAAKDKMPGTVALAHGVHGASPVQPQDAASVSAPGGNSDTTGVVKSVNRSDGKLTLKHGPIRKFDMPAMTMVFRVNDLRLLDQIKEGDVVGVTVDRTGSAMVITGIQR
jgi:Cu/Ag efflux protein CusF